MHRSLTLFLPIGLSISAFAQTVNTVADGSWTSPGTWSCGCVPSSSHSPVILHSVDLLGDLTLDHPQVQVTSTGEILTSFPVAVHLNTTFIMEGHVFFQGSVTVGGLADISGFFEVAGTLTNSGSMVFDGGVMQVEGDLINEQSISGEGSICVYDLTSNAGSITGTVDICDLSPTTTTPPILDMNTGTVDPGVTYCTSSFCATGVAEDGVLNGPLVFPNPASDRIHIIGLPTGVTSIELVDMAGRSVPVMHARIGDQVMVDLGMVGAGAYTLIARGARVHRAMRLIVDRGDLK